MVMRARGVGMRLAVSPLHPQPRKIGIAVDALLRGGVIAYPTDTVYGIGCDITNKRAIERVYQIKGIPRDQLLSFVCPDLSDIARYGFVDDAAYRIMRRLVPGPYTFILKATKEVPRVLMMKRKTVGIRVPDHPVALELTRALGRPIISTSASRDGETLVDPADISEAFPRLDMVIDADVCGNVPSTIIDLSGEEAVVQRVGAGPVDFLRA
jgi:tRNA threonylcarbamoyl adenosine modification protein (Sua5/YciO/YrdC/YwlC family)